jgi:cytochrome c-type biogenesis protein
MADYGWGLAYAFGLGVYTSVTPCALAANIAAIAYIGRRLGNSRQILLTALLFVVGQTAGYVALGVALVSSVLASGAISSFLQQNVNELLGPALILTAMCLLGLINFQSIGPGAGANVQKRIDALGLWGALFLGVVLALTFCPVSAGLFFLTVIPAAVELNSRVGLPVAYALGSALPVAAFALVMAFGVQSLGKAFDRVGQMERWARRGSGIMFLLLGIHLTMRYIFGLRI